MGHQSTYEAMATPPLHAPLDADAKPVPHKIARIAHWLAGLLMLYAIFGTTVIYSQTSVDIMNDFLCPLFGVDPYKWPSGHYEMVDVGYFFFASILPIVVAFLLVRLVSHGATFPVLRVSYALQRKPRFLHSLVTYGEALFLLLVVGGNILFFYFSYTIRVEPTSTNERRLEAAAAALGFLTAYNMAFLALPASRHCFWMEWLGIPYAHGIKYHRWLGILSILALALHTLVYVVAYARKHELLKMLPCFDCDIANEGYENWMISFGWLSGFAMFVMGLTSIAFIRRRYYNVFYVTHFLFIPAMLFATLHWSGVLLFCFAPIVLYIGNRMMPLATISAPVVVRKAISYPHQVTELVVEIATHYQAGDVVYLKVPSVSKTQWHPFSVASTPLHTPGTMTIYLKNLGRWSSQVFEYIRQCTASGVDPVVYMDGGYVSPALVPASYEKVVFIGGGIGVTPLMAQIMHVLYTAPSQEVHLVWHVRDLRMMTQFQQWFHEATGLSSNLRLHLFVTKTSPPAEETSSSTVFDLKASDVPPRPYANVSMLRQTLLFLGAFLGAGVLFVAVHYGNKITSINEAYWPIQSFMEFLAIVVGAYWAYIVVLIKPYTPTPVAKTPFDEMPKEPMMSDEAFIERYSVQQGRMDWSHFFSSLVDGTTKSWTTPAIGVYVSGPKTLSRAIDAQAHSTRFAVHHEEFEM